MPTGIYDRTTRAINRTEKLCPDCNLIKPINAFHKNGARSDGRQSNCMKCMRTRNLATQRGRWLLNKFGITEAEYDSRLARQGFGCAICGRKRNEQRKKLTVDHCHKTGRIRGILCSACNTGIGNLGDDPLRLLAAIKYLQGAQDDL